MNVIEVLLLYKNELDLRFKQNFSGLYVVTNCYCLFLGRFYEELAPFLKHHVNFSSSEP